MKGICGIIYLKAGVLGMEFNETVKFSVGNDKETRVRDILSIVYEALKVKGYNPINQIVGYIMSGDPSYITSLNNARTLINKLERDEILEELLKNYLEEK